LQDIDKAIELKPEESIYKEHKEIVEKIKKERIVKELEKTRKILARTKRSYEKIKERKQNMEDVVFTRSQDSTTQYKILKEMREKYTLAIKFFTESKNEEQLTISYKEIESFLDNFFTFRFYFRFSPNNLNPEIVELLDEDEKNVIKEEEIIKLVDEFKYKLCEDTFSEGNYNFQLFQYALEKVFEEERKVREEEERIIEESKPKVSWLAKISKSKFTVYLGAGLIVFSMGMVASHYYMYSGSIGPGSFFK